MKPEGRRKMNQSPITLQTLSRHRRDLPRVSLALAGFALALPVVGCARQLTITQDPHINTAMHINRPPDQRTGEPLEINIVCVYPEDFEKPDNAQLSPEIDITSDVWYQRRPTRGGTEPGKFDLPPEQILVFTDAADCYGKKAGPRLKGALEDGRADIKIKGGIKFRAVGGVFKNKGGLRSRKSAIYVFPRFVDARGQVLPVRPVKWSPPGAYSRDLHCKIGVRDPEGHAQQYIESLTTR